jgi:hypothetical protein
VKAVREYRDHYPDKAIFYNAEENCPSIRDGWATLIAGGSLAAVKLPTELAKLIPSMRPADGITRGDNQWCLANKDGEFLIYTDRADESIALTLPDEGARYRIRVIDPNTGDVTDRGEVAADRQTSLQLKSDLLWFSRLSSKP